MDSKTVENLWSHIRTLGIIAETGSYTAAAQRMDISKSAISLRIAELERATGVALVRRTTRSVRLTEAGQQLVDSTRTPFEEISQHFASVRDQAEQPSGVLRVTAPVALGRQQIVPRMAAFLLAYPAVRVELELSDRLTSLSQEGYDLAIRHTNAAPESHVAWTLCPTYSVLVATRAYLKRHGTPATPQDLASHACLSYLRRGEQASWSFERLKGDKQRVSVGIAGNFSANNSEALREAALGGLGIALLPDFSAQADVAAGKLAVVLPDWRPVGAFGEKLLALRPYSPYVPRAVRVYVDYLRQTLKGGFTA